MYLRTKNKLCKSCLYVIFKTFTSALENGSGSGMNPFSMMGAMGGMPGMAGLMGMPGMQGLNSGQISNMWGGMAGRGGLPGMGMGGFNRGMMEQVRK